MPIHVHQIPSTVQRGGVDTIRDYLLGNYKPLNLSSPTPLESLKVWHCGFGAHGV